MAAGICLAPDQPMIRSMLSRNGSNANNGLVFDRYLEIWEERDSASPAKVKQIVDTLNDFSSRFKDCDLSMLNTLHDRQNRILERFGNKARMTFPMTTAWRLACGLGYDHPSENGFLMDYNTGLPYLPASEIKGLCRHVAAHYTTMEAMKSEWSKEVFYALFGSEKKDPDPLDKKKQLGDIVFLDAYPQGPINVKPDVVNVHYKSYYQAMGENQGEKVKDQLYPMGTDNPVPVFFLTIGAGTRFVFRFFSRTKKEDNIKKMETPLMDGLTLFGIGAKTAAGYGRFVPADGASGGSSEASPLSGAAEWVRSTVAALCDKHNVPDSLQILRGKVLAEEWKRLTDGEFRASVATEIRKQWEKQGLTISKKVKQLYEEGTS